jgi:hypothetical protein
VTEEIKRCETGDEEIKRCETGDEEIKRRSEIGDGRN